MLPNYLIPNFNEILKTDWSKPQFDSKDKNSVIDLVAPVAMLISVFLPWCILSWEGETSDAYLGIQTWFGVFAFIAAVIAVAGALYKHRSLSFWGAVVGVVFGLIGAVVIPGASSEEIAIAEAFGVEFSHFGAYIYIIACAATAVIAYKNNE